MRGRGIRGRLILAVTAVVTIGLVLLVGAFNLILSQRLDHDIDAVLSARAGAQVDALDLADGELAVIDVPDEATAESQAWVYSGKKILAHPRTVNRRIDRAAAQLAGGPVHELRVSVPNSPGVVAALALALGRAGINITDMALYPAADMREGVVALWIAGDEPAARAQQLVAELGFPVARA